MTTITLLNSTGYTQTDDIVCTLIAQFETSFPGRIVSYYVEGSYADQTAVTTSDLDLTIVFREQFRTADERAAAQQTATACAQSSPVELDLTLAEEINIRQAADPAFKLGARLLVGQEIRDAIPLMPIATWAHQRMHAAYWLMINVFQRPKPVQAPLTFPQPMAPFYGYTARTMRLADGRELPTTRNLIRVTGWIATARLAYEGQQYVIRKRDCVPAYRQIIHDEWTALLEQIDQRCRTDWRYCIPPTDAEQAELRTILIHTLAFENDFLTRYRAFLLAELTGSDEAVKQDALRLLGHTFYADPAIIEAIRHLQARAAPETRAAAQALMSSTVFRAYA